MISEIERYTGIYNHPVVTTSNAVPVNIASIDIPEGYAGSIKYTVAGVADDGSGHISGYHFVRFRRSGAIFCAQTDIVPMHDDFSECTYGPHDAGGSLVIQVISSATRVINWVVRTELLWTNATNIST